MPISAFSDSYAFDIALATDGTPNGVANVEKSVSQAVINSICSPFNGGKSVGVGLGNTVGELVKMWAGKVVLDAVERKFGVDVNPF